ncbi:MAG: relaxase/mobilization nuclease domain-containing protein [Emcibacter sp.]|nr:relaxase/mobilization nuclease domain-containing protein [Emcibacter sp.]
MILKGSQRGNGQQLALHLGNKRDNDHVYIEQIRGFISETLEGAFGEAHAISKTTRCKQFLFSLSFNPPADAVVSADTFLDAIERAEEKLGLDGQPRAIVFHEKEGRRHAHVVWSRIDHKTMTAINLPHFKNKLANLSKELYLENSWDLPRGHREAGWKNPLNYTLAEFQAARRIGIEDPREIKQVFNQAFTQSDSARAFKAALEDSGYYLAKGDRRGMVAIDLHGKVYSAARWAGVKTKELRAKFGEPDNLLSVDQTRKMIRQNLSQKMRDYMADMRAQYREALEPFQVERKIMVARQRIDRAKQKHTQKRRFKKETHQRAARYRSGLMGVVDLLFGRRREAKKLNTIETATCLKRDQGQREALFFIQHKERRGLQKRIAVMKQNQISERKRLTARIADVLNITREQNRQPDQARQRNRDRGFDLSP